MACLTQQVTPGKSPDLKLYPAGVSVEGFNSQRRWERSDNVGRFHSETDVTLYNLHQICLRSISELTGSHCI